MRVILYILIIFKPILTYKLLFIMDLSDHLESLGVTLSTKFRKDRFKMTPSRRSSIDKALATLNNSIEDFAVDAYNTHIASLIESYIKEDENDNADPSEKLTSPFADCLCPMCTILHKILTTQKVSYEEIKKVGFNNLGVAICTAVAKDEVGESTITLVADAIVNAYKEAGKEFELYANTMASKLSCKGIIRSN